MRCIALAVLAVMALIAPVANADQGGGGRQPAVVPAVNLEGNSGGELLGDWYAHNLSLPADKSPFAGSADLCLDIGHNGKVLSPSGGVDRGGFLEMSCTVKVGRPVLLVMTSSDCSTAEPPPYFAVTEATQRACAIAALGGYNITSITVSLDGAPAIDIHNPRYFASSPQRSVVFPVNPVFDARPGPARFTAVAWIAELTGMRKGVHDVHAALNLVSAGKPVSFPFIVHFNVVNGSDD
jgi:hypothetical protein